MLGCGSLAIGQHLSRFLDPGGHAGVGITDRFYRDGPDWMESSLVDAK